jgi:hypothetical protein
MNQHDFIKGCLLYYEEEGINPGNPDEGVWQDAHYPAPNPEGSATIPLLFDHHQIQGLLQSEEYNRVCFWLGDAKKFLTLGPFVAGWFELWDIYDKWSSESGRTMNNSLHLKDDSGRSQHNVKLHSEKSCEGKSLQAIKMAEASHSDRDAEGKSIRMLKINSKKNEEGKSIVAVKGAEVSNTLKNENGKSVNATKGAKEQHKLRYLCLKTGFVSSPCGLSSYQRARGIDTNLREKVK